MQGRWSVAIAGEVAVQGRWFCAGKMVLAWTIRMDYFFWGRWSLQGRWFLLREMVLAGEMVSCSSRNRG